MCRHSLAHNGVTEAFNYADGFVASSDTTQNNSLSNFKMADSLNAYNFEIDLETVRLFPVEIKSDVEIPFYHPGSKSGPKNYIFKRLEDETITISNKSISCWVYKIEYSNNGFAKFYLNKENRDLVLVDESFGTISRKKTNIKYIAN
ncbi:hypothetical protein EP331_02465 [bacterium]|nr:MAG: hypothetical protein EP331_02465 [bacterium]